MSLSSSQHPELTEGIHNGPVVSFQTSTAGGVGSIPGQGSCNSQKNYSKQNLLGCHSPKSSYQLQEVDCQPPFADEETGAQRGDITCPGSQLVRCGAGNGCVAFWVQ